MRKDIRYVPTPYPIVDAMLELAGLTSSDFLIDLGCGDGRIPIRAALAGARSRGIDIDQSLVRRSVYNAMSAGVSEKAEFLVGDLFQADLREATVVSLYLRHKTNAELQPKLQNELKAGSRVVSHSFCMVDWEPEAEIEVETKLLFLWVVR